MNELLPLATLFGPMLAGVLIVAMNHHYARAAAKANIEAQIAVSEAATKAARASGEAATAARQLIDSARAQSSAMNRIASVTAETQRIVNGERTRLLTENMFLKRQIANDNPDNQEYQLAADRAEECRKETLAAEKSGLITSTRYGPRGIEK
jgi:hypothetical protein